MDGSEVDEVRLEVDGDATNVDETFLLDMIALDHLRGAAQIELLVFERARWEDKGLDAPGCTNSSSHWQAMAIECALKNSTGFVGLALAPRLAVAAPGAGLNIVVVVAMTCLERGGRRGDDEGTESEDGGESEAHDEIVELERRGLAGWCLRV